MTTITAQIIADSISEAGKRLTTFQLRYPRAIHAEVMTHRVFSRNASSSRAIPVERLIQDVIDDPFIPLHWGANQKGMQAYEENQAEVKYRVPDYEPPRGLGYTTHSTHRKLAWLMARDNAVEMAQAFADAGYHKQLVNRLLEPFAHINVVLTGTEFANFFALRDHHAAEPHLQMLARAMKEAAAASTPKLLRMGEWHLPYAQADVVTVQDAKVQSIACCASVSYKTVDGKPMTLDRAKDLVGKLLTDEYVHASPFEHQATPDRYIDPHAMVRQWANPHLHGNLVGWCQNRKFIPNENIAA